MAKCGHNYCPDTNCGLKHPFNGGRRAECRRIQGCFEGSCNSLKAYGPSGFALYDACLGHCHRVAADPKYPANYPTVDQYLCDNFDPVSLVDYFGVNPCGVDPGQTNVGKAQAKEATTQSIIWTVVAIILIAAGLLTFYLLRKK